MPRKLIEKMDDDFWGDLIESVDEKFRSKLVGRLCEEDVYHHSCRSESSKVDGSEGQIEYSCHVCGRTLKVTYDLTSGDSIGI